jgi:hypothetical protein
MKMIAVLMFGFVLMIGCESATTPPVDDAGSDASTAAQTAGQTTGETAAQTAAQADAGATAAQGE